MTTILPCEYECSVCGQTSKHYEIGSTNTWGYQDMDTRPPEMMRSTISNWIQECPHCGYVSQHICDEMQIEREYLDSEEYINCSGIDFKDDLSKRFYRHYLISLKTNDIPEAFYAALHCAWTCDDNCDKNAVPMRKIAVGLADKLMESDRQKNETLLVMKSDLMRRSGEFEELINQFSGISLDEELFNRIIEFQIERAREKDDSCYTLEELAELG